MKEIMQIVFNHPTNQPPTNQRSGSPQVEVRRIVKSSPGILTFSIDENMRPKLDWLRERMGLDAHGIRKMVGRNGRVLSLKVCM